MIACVDSSQPIITMVSVWQWQWRSAEQRSSPHSRVLRRAVRNCGQHISTDERAHTFDVCVQFMRLAAFVSMCLRERERECLSRFHPCVADVWRAVGREGNKDLCTENSRPRWANDLWANRRCQNRAQRPATLGLFHAAVSDCCLDRVQSYRMQYATIS